MKSTWKKLLPVRRHRLLRFLAGYFMCIRNQFSQLMMGKIFRFTQFWSACVMCVTAMHEGVHVLLNLSKMRFILFFLIKL